MNVSWLTEPSPSYCGAQLASQRLGGGRLGQSAFARAHGATQQQRSAPGDALGVEEMVGNISTGNPSGKQWGWEVTQPFPYWSYWTHEELW